MTCHLLLIHPAFFDLLLCWGPVVEAVSLARATLQGMKILLSLPKLSPEKFSACAHQQFGHTVAWFKRWLSRTRPRLLLISNGSVLSWLWTINNKRTDGRGIKKEQLSIVQDGQRNQAGLALCEVPSQHWVCASWHFSSIPLIMLKKKYGERSEPLMKTVRGAACWVGFRSQGGGGPVGKKAGRQKLMCVFSKVSQSTADLFKPYSVSTVNGWLPNRAGEIFNASGEHTAAFIVVMVVGFGV